MHGGSRISTFVENNSVYLCVFFRSEIATILYKLCWRCSLKAAQPRIKRLSLSHQVHGAPANRWKIGLHWFYSQLELQQVRPGALDLN